MKIAVIIVIVVILVLGFWLGLPYFQGCAAHHGFISKGLCYTPTGIYWPWS